MMNRLGRIFWVAAVLLAGCVKPEDGCRSGVASLKPRVDSVAGYIEHPHVNELMAQARDQYNQARAQRDAGNYEDCLASAEQSEVLLHKAKRLRQELAK
jgi:hypothetical protein